MWEQVSESLNGQFHKQRSARACFQCWQKLEKPAARRMARQRRSAKSRIWTREQREEQNLRSRHLPCGARPERALLTRRPASIYTAALRTRSCCHRRSRKSARNARPTRARTAKGARESEGTRTRQQQMQSTSFSYRTKRPRRCIARPAAKSRFPGERGRNFAY